MASPSLNLMPIVEPLTIPLGKRLARCRTSVGDNSPHLKGGALTRRYCRMRDDSYYHDMLRHQGRIAQELYFAVLAFDGARFVCHRCIRSLERLVLVLIGDDNLGRSHDTFSIGIPWPHYFKDSPRCPTGTRLRCYSLMYMRIECFSRFADLLYT
jgi:hypothetical protein